MGDLQGYQTDFEKGVKRATTAVNFLTKLSDVGEKSDLAVTTPIDLVNAIMTGRVAPYARNRGSGKINFTRVAEIVQKFNIDDIGQLTLVDFGNNQYQIRDGHHRIYALIDLFKSGSLDSYKDVKISIRIVPESEKMRAYANLNNVRSHSLKDKITNEDLGLGRLIKKTLTQADLSPALGVTIIDDGKKTLIGQIVIAISEMPGHKDMDFEKMIRSSSKRIKILANELPEEFGLRLQAKSTTDLVEAIDFGVAVLKRFVQLQDLNQGSKLSAKLNSQAQNLTANGMLFAAIVWDKYTGRHVFGQLDPKTIAKKFSDKLSDSSIAASLMSAKKYSEAFQFFFRIIRTKETNVLGLE